MGTNEVMHINPSLTTHGSNCIQLSIYHSLTFSSHISIILAQNCHTAAVSQYINVVSLLLLAQKLAPLNCVEHSMLLSASFPGLCDRREVLWRVFGIRCIRVMLRNIFRLISTPLPVQPLPCFNSRWFDLGARSFFLHFSVSRLCRVGSVIWRAASVNRDRLLIALGQRQSWHPLGKHAQLKLS